MTKLIAFIFTAFLANTAFASWIVPVEIGFCTRDLTEWDKSGSCECPKDTSYERALGQCVQGSVITVAIDGVVTTVAGFDEEAPSFVLTNETQESYQLVLKKDDKAKLEKLQAHDFKYRLSGRLIENHPAALTPDDVLLFIVDSIEKLPAFRGELSQ